MNSNNKQPKEQKPQVPKNEAPKNEAPKVEQPKIQQLTANNNVDFDNDYEQEFKIKERKLPNSDVHKQYFDFGIKRKEKETPAIDFDKKDQGYFRRINNIKNDNNDFDNNFDLNVEIDPDYERSFGPSPDKDEFPEEYEKYMNDYNDWLKNGESFDKFDNENEEVSDFDISERLGDDVYYITDGTTVKDYANHVAEGLGVDVNRVLDIIKKNEAYEVTDDMPMSRVAGLEDPEETETEEFSEDNFIAKLRNNKYTPEELEFLDKLINNYKRGK